MSSLAERLRREAAWMEVLGSKGGASRLLQIADEVETLEAQAILAAGSSDPAVGGAYLDLSPQRARSRAQAKGGNAPYGRRKEDKKAQ